MPDASWLQPSFLGGEWSPYAQGRIDHPAYRTAMQLCLNAYPVEEGACPRRPGFAFMAPTRNGAYGRVIPFDFTDDAPFTLELTALYMRIFQGLGLCFDSYQNVLNISPDTPAVVTVSSTESWATGDQIQFLFQSTQTAADCAILRNRQFAITVLNDEQFTIADPLTGAAVDGAQVGFDPEQTLCQAAHILQITTPWPESALQAVRSVQMADIYATDENVALLLHNSYKPQALSATLDTGAPNFSTFTLSPQDFADGPYLDPPSGATITPNATSGNINMTIGYTAWSSSTPYTLGDFVSYGGDVWQSIAEVNLDQTPAAGDYWEQVNAGAAVGPNGFQSTDVGRSMRFLSEPAIWDSGTAYSIGDAVKYNDTYYVAVAASTGAEPDLNLADWLPSSAPTVYTWTWGKITAVVSSSEVTVNLYGEDVDGNPANLLYEAAIQTWQMGAYSATTGYPACGCWYEGRLWLSGAIANRVDGSNSDDPFNFAPTAPDGTVGDGNAVSATFNSDDTNTIYFLQPTSVGLMAGTKSGEWLIQASTLEDPITPTSIQAHRRTKVGCFNQIPCNTPLTTVFIHKYQRMLFEYFPDVFSGKMTAPNLNIFSKHLTAAGIEEIAYQSELAPIIWARMGDGSLAGWTYRRISAFSNEDPKFVGAHRHTLGGGWSVISLCVGPVPDQTSDTPIIVAQSTTTGFCHVMQGTQLMDPADPITDQWFVDDAVTPSGILTSATGVTLYGLWQLNGNKVSAVIGGLDCGDYTVSNGSIFVPWQSDPGKFLTLAYLQSLNSNDFGGLAVKLDVTVTSTPGTASTPQGIADWSSSWPAIPVNFSSSSIVVNWATSTAYLFGGGNGLRQISVAGGNQIQAATQAQLCDGAPDNTVNGNWAYGVGQDGNLYFQQGVGNTGPIIKVTASTLTYVSSFGQDGSGLSPSNNGIPKSIQLLCLNGAGTNYALCVYLSSAESYGLTALDTDTMSWVGSGSTYDPFTEPEAFGCVLHSGSDAGSALFVGCPSGASALSSFNLYLTTIGASAAFNTSVVGNITATAVDPQWIDGFTNVSGPALDQEDGNVLIGVGTETPNVRYSAYLLKVEPETGEIIWRVGFNDAIPSFDSLNNSRIQGGVYAWMGGGAGPSRTVYWVNTSTGQLNTFTVTNVEPTGAQVFDAVTGTLTLYCDYSSTGGAPTPDPGTPSSFTNQWAQLTPGNILKGTTTSTSSYTIPAVVGYTYTTQGQTVRPALPQEAGAANGPAQGKTRRHHMYTLLAAGIIYGTVLIGASFSKMRGVYPKQANGVALPTNELYSGVLWDTIEGDYGFDGGLCWQVTRPVAAHIANIGGFINTQDR